MEATHFLVLLKLMLDASICCMPGISKETLPSCCDLFKSGNKSIIDFTDFLCLSNILKDKTVHQVYLCIVLNLKYVHKNDSHQVKFL